MTTFWCCYDNIFFWLYNTILGCIIRVCLWVFIQFGSFFLCLWLVLETVGKIAWQLDLILGTSVMLTVLVWVGLACVYSYLESLYTSKLC